MMDFLKAFIEESATLPEEIVEISSVILEYFNYKV
jgi:hypothetical protein